MKRSPFRPIARTAVLVAFLGVASLAQAQVVSTPTDTVTGQAPTVDSAEISFTGSGPNGELRIGDTLTAAYTQADADADPEDQAATRGTLQWLSDGAPVGTLGSSTYTIEASDAGKKITFRVQPHTNIDDTDPYQGALTLSKDVNPASSGNSGGGEIVIPGGGTVLSVTVNGNPVVGQTLTAQPTCMTTCSGVSYQWQIESAVGSGSFTNIAGATDETYVVKRDEQKRRIQVVANAQ